MRIDYLTDIVFHTEPLARDTVKVGNNWYIVDTCKTPDAGWETGVAKVNTKKMYEEIAEEWGEDLTDEEIIELADEYVYDWGIQNYKTKREALAGHKRVCKNGKLDGKGSGGKKC